MIAYFDPDVTLGYDRASSGVKGLCNASPDARPEKGSFAQTGVESTKADATN
jgi:hypothetical protein